VKRKRIDILHDDPSQQALRRLKLADGNTVLLFFPNISSFVIKATHKLFPGSLSY
jgi:hypothetical protein